MGVPAKTLPCRPDRHRIVLTQRSHEVWHLGPCGVHRQPQPARTECSKPDAAPQSEQTAFWVTRRSARLARARRAGHRPYLTWLQRAACKILGNVNLLFLVCVCVILAQGPC